MKLEIVFIQGKGGVGKTTMAYLTAVSLLDAGHKVAIKDSDPQQSLKQFLSEHENLVSEEEAKFIIHDTPPRLESELVTEAIGSADRIIVPSGPSNLDFSVAIQTSQLVDKFKKPEAKAFCVFNKIRRGTNWEKDLLSGKPEKMLSIPVSKVRFNLKESFNRVLDQGVSNLDTGDKETVANFILSII